MTFSCDSTHGQRRICQMTLLAFMPTPVPAAALSLPSRSSNAVTMMNLRDLGMPCVPHNELPCRRNRVLSRAVTASINFSMI